MGRSHKLFLATNVILREWKLEKNEDKDCKSK